MELVNEIDRLIYTLEHSKSFYDTEEAKENHWKRHVTNAETFEKPLIAVMPDVWKSARLDALQAVKRGHTSHVNKTKIRELYKQHATPIIKNCLESFIQSGMDLVSPTNPHKAGPIPPVVSQAAIDWLKTRINWAGMQIGETLADDLAQSLAEGYQLGESISDLTTRVMDFFDDPVRAERIARTETITASNQGALFGYQDAGLDQCEFYTAQDERTCDLCNSMNGMIFNLEYATNVITGSTHPDCRCCWLPVIK
jgi:SPP1 gp7 family putative phage head morphogenesis protein